MKVKELVKQLQELPQEDDIVITAMDDYFFEDTFEVHSPYENGQAQEIIIDTYFKRECHEYRNDLEQPTKAQNTFMKNLVSNQRNLIRGIHQYNLNWVKDLASVVEKFMAQIPNQVKHGELHKKLKGWTILEQTDNTDESINLWVQPNKNIGIFLTLEPNDAGFEVQINPYIEYYWNGDTDSDDVMELHWKVLRGFADGTYSWD